MMIKPFFYISPQLYFYKYAIKESKTIGEDLYWTSSHNPAEDQENESESRIGLWMLKTNQ